MANIETWTVKQYHATVEELLQQKDSRFASACRIEDQHSEEQFWDQIGVASTEENDTRYADSPQFDITTARRRNTLRKFRTGKLLDQFDQVKTLVDPKSPYTKAMTQALNRDKDDVWISAYYGTAYTGKAGATSTSYDTANEVAVSFGGAGDVGLTVGKLIEAKRLLLTNEVDPDEEIYIAIGPKQWQDLMNTVEYTSSDYAGQNYALMSGKTISFMGMKWILSNRLSTSGGDRRCPVWIKDGMLMAFGSGDQMGIFTRIAERPDKSFNWYAYMHMFIGATRMQENKCASILCNE